MKRKIVTALLIFCGVLWPVHTQLFSADSPQSAETKRIVDLVDKAAALTESKGKNAFPEFKKKGSEWFKGESYVFILDMNGVTLMHPANPELETKSTIDLKDANGKTFVRDFVETAKTKRSGWVDYMWPKPGEKSPSKKLSYVKAAKLPNGENGARGRRDLFPMIGDRQSSLPAPGHPLGRGRRSLHYRPTANSPTWSIGMPHWCALPSSSGGRRARLNLAGLFRLSAAKLDQNATQTDNSTTSDSGVGATSSTWPLITIDRGSKISLSCSAWLAEDQPSDSKLPGRKELAHESKQKHQKARIEARAFTRKTLCIANILGLKSRLLASLPIRDFFIAMQFTRMCSQVWSMGSRPGTGLL